VREGERGEGGREKRQNKKRKARKYAPAVPAMRVQTSMLKVEEKRRRRRSRSKSRRAYPPLFHVGYADSVQCANAECASVVPAYPSPTPHRSTPSPTPFLCMPVCGKGER